MKTNLEIAQAFLNGKKASNRSMSTDGETLYSYNTPIAEFAHDGTLIVNTTRYSVTTSGKHYPALRKALTGRNFKTVYVDNVPMRSWSLQNYVKAEETA